MRLLGLVWVCVATAALAAGTPLYSVQNLGALGTGSAQVTGMNSSGVVTGYVTNVEGDTVPMCFIGCSGGLNGIGQANAVNAAGEIVGTTYAGADPYVTVWAGGSGSAIVPGYGNAVNASGVVAGGYVSPNGQLHAFTLSNGRLTDLGTLAGATQSSARGINTAGHVVGTSLANGVFQAFFSTGNGMTALRGLAGGGSSYAMAINDNDIAAGAAQTSGGWLHATEWIGGSPVDLGTLGGTLSYAYGINSGGAAVGYSYLAGNTAEHAFLFTNGVMVDLNDLLPVGAGWTIDYAYAIDDAGGIAGMGTRNGEQYALELIPAVTTFSDPTPVPEPSTLMLIGLGLLVLSKIPAAKRKSKVSETRSD